MICASACIFFQVSFLYSCVHDCVFWDLRIHVGVVFALIVFLLVSFLSLCIRVGVSLGSVYSLSMSIQDMCTRVGVMFSFVYSCWSQCLDLCGFILLYR